MKIEITLEQLDKIKRLSDFADYWLDDMKPDSAFYLEQWESDKEEILQAQEVIQDIEQEIYWQEEQAIRSARTDAWLVEANKQIREGNV